MVLIGIAVDRLDLLGRAGQGGLHVAALVADERLLGVEALLEPFSNRRARDLGVLALVPNDREGIEGGLGLPPAVGDDGDSIIFDLHHLLHAVVAGDLGRVEALHFAAIDGAGLDRGVEHAGQFDVDAVDGLARDLVVRVEPFDALADDLPILRVLERDLSRRLNLGGGFRHLAVGGGAAGRLVRDHAVRRAHLGYRHFPLIGSGLLEHLAGHRTAFADELVRLANSAAASGEEVAPYALAGDVLARRREFIADLRPVAFEFLGDELGKPGERALAHLRAGDANDHRVVRTDHHPGVALGRAALRANDLRAPERNIEAERQTAAHGGRAHHEAAAIDLRYVIHGCLPHALAAAAWIAARTCWKVPQRQILVMLTSMSASVGLGLSWSSAPTAMIIPHWQ